jgi:hypothetical protein
MSGKSSPVAAKKHAVPSKKVAGHDAAKKSTSGGTYDGTNVVGLDAVGQEAVGHDSDATFTVGQDANVYNSVGHDKLIDLLLEESRKKERKDLYLSVCTADYEMKRNLKVLESLESDIYYSKLSDMCEHRNWLSQIKKSFADRQKTLDKMLAEGAAEIYNGAKRAAAAGDD